MIGSCNCPITANCPIRLYDYSFGDSLEKNTALSSPITFEKHGGVDFEFSRAIHARTN